MTYLQFSGATQVVLPWGTSTSILFSTASLPHVEPWTMASELTSVTTGDLLLRFESNVGARNNRNLF